jgi:glycosyltransferase involved in cell wall biosynthesis
MRIVYPYPAYWPYMRRGVERCIHDLTTYLVSRGHEVDIITSKPGRSRIAYDGGVRVVYLRQVSHPLMYKYAPLLRLYSFGAQASVHVLRNDYDVMHLWSYSAIMMAPLMKKLLGKPYLFHLIMRRHEWPGRFDRMVFSQLIKHANSVAALTPGGARENEEHFDVPTMTLPPPVNMTEFAPRGEKDLLRPRILFTGDLGDPRKGGPLLLRAWNEIHRRCPQAVLVLAGPSGLGFDQGFDVYTLERIEDLVPSPAARAAIEVPGAGAVQDLPLEYARAAVTVLPSVEEAFGMVVTESLASGTPVVCSAYGGPGEIITNPEVGITVPLQTYNDLISEQKAQQLAQAVLGAIELAGTPGNAARCREWAEPFRLERVGAAVEELLMEMAVGRSLSSPRVSWPA